eukprot:TRINITY_DN2647_c0_g1_i3.p1 TRINITY_DN2647_c0_g1~~TRINITY_DN2647_c0_g1_i3.p1  ORF type:complete len:246 (-),score=-8.68 TRINITY_DN2647_c0_g1_i3:279-1016(-)
MKTISLICIIFVILEIVPILAIVGGAEVSAGHDPWMASLSRTSHFGAGTVISKRSILTSASVLDDAYGTGIMVRVGSLRYASGGALIRASKIIKHPDFNAKTFENDVAIIILSADIPDNIEHVALASEPPNLSKQQSVRVAGWGTTSQGAKSLPSILRSVDLNTETYKECHADYPSEKINKDQTICLYATGGGKGACSNSDKGGAATINNTLVGIISRPACGKHGKPDITTSVAAYRNWIIINMV